MKFKQKHAAMQAILNEVQTGTSSSSGDGKKRSGDSYTKKESGELFLTKKNAEGTYQTKSNMINYALKSDAVPMVTEKDTGKVLTAKYVDEKKGRGSFSWEEPNDVPTITEKDSGKFLRANYYNATSTSTYSWESLPEELPQVTSDDKGKVLTAQYNSREGGSCVWANSPTIPDYEKALDGATLVVKDVNGVNSLVWANLIPLTNDKEDIGKVLTINYTTTKAKTPTLSWKEIIPDYSKAKEGAVLTVKIINGEPKLVWE